MLLVGNIVLMSRKGGVIRPPRKVQLVDEHVQTMKNGTRRDLVGRIASASA
jgi:hypothetical protein